MRRVKIRKFLIHEKDEQNYVPKYSEWKKELWKKYEDDEDDDDDDDGDDDDGDDDDDDDEDARDEFEPNIVLHALSWLRRRYMTQNIFFLRVCAEDGKTGIKSRPTDFPTKAHHGDLISL